MVDTKILRRIEKCLALGESSNRHEAAAALRQAKKLMDQFNIDHDTLTAAKVKAETPNYDFRAEKMPLAQQWLCTVMAMAFDVRCYLTMEIREIRLTSGATRTKAVQVPVFYGIGSDAEIAAYTFDVTARQLDRERKAYLKTLKGLPAPQKTKLANSFCEGWVSEVRNTVSTFAGSIDQQKTTAMDIWAKQNLGNLRTRKARTRRISYAQVEAMNAGREKGSDVRLHTGTGYDGDENRICHQV